jgi:hypothetical protein
MLLTSSKNKKSYQIHFLGKQEKIYARIIDLSGSTFYLFYGLAPYRATAKKEGVGGGGRRGEGGSTAYKWG